MYMRMEIDVLPPLNFCCIECLESVGRDYLSVMEKLNSASVYFLSFDLVGEPVT